MTKLLEVGDILFTYHFGKINSKLKITRVTPKRAYVGETAYHREVDEYGYVTKTSRDKWSTTITRIASPERIKEWNTAVLIHKIRGIGLAKLNKLPFSDLMTLHKLLQKTEDVEE